MLLAEARLLRPAKRQLVVGDDDRVHPRVAGLELLHRAMRGGHVGGPDRRTQAELRVVGKTEPFIEVFDLAHRQRRSEDLFLPHAGVVGHLADDGRLDEPALLVLGTVRPAASVDQLRATIERVLELGLDLGALRFGVHRAHAAVLVEPITRLELRRARDELLQERVIGALLNVKPLRGKTLLAAVEEAADRDRAGGAFEVGIVEHDAWIAAAELERDLLQGLGRFRHHALARRRGAGERDLADQRMLDDRLTCRLAADDVDHSVRQAAFPERFYAQPGGQRPRARGLQHDGCAGRHRRRYLAGGEGAWTVPWHARV